MSVWDLMFEKNKTKQKQNISAIDFTIKFFRGVSNLSPVPFRRLPILTPTPRTVLPIPCTKPQYVYDPSGALHNSSGCDCWSNYPRQCKTADIYDLRFLGPDLIKVWKLIYSTNWVSPLKRTQFRHSPSCALSEDYIAGIMPKPSFVTIW